MTTLFSSSKSLFDTPVTTSKSEVNEYPNDLATLSAELTQEYIKNEDPIQERDPSDAILVERNSEVVKEVVKIAEDLSSNPKVENKKSNYLGVSWSKNAKKWQVVVNLGRDPETKKSKSASVGVFKDEHEAAKAYNEYVTKNSLNKKLNEIKE